MVILRIGWGRIMRMDSFEIFGYYVVLGGKFGERGLWLISHRLLSTVSVSLLWRKTLAPQPLCLKTSGANSKRLFRLQFFETEEKGDLYGETKRNRTNQTGS